MPSAPIVIPSEIETVFEFHRGAASRPNAFFDFGGQPPQVEVARPDLDPGVGDADDRPAQVLIREANGFQHRTGRGAIGAIRDGAAVAFWVRHEAASLLAGRQNTGAALWFGRLLCLRCVRLACDLSARNRRRRQPKPVKALNEDLNKDDNNKADAE
jgi:hypothetical protein